MAAETARCLRELSGLCDGEGVVAAVSGGSDSVALLLLLLEASSSGLLPLRLSVAHLHHGLRGPGADRDLAFVEALARKFGLPFFSGRADVPALAGESGGGVEAAGRLARYSFLAKAAREAGARAVATGHTLDDQAETVLYRLVRGTGSRGLVGILPSRPICTDPRILLVRPVLGFSRAELAAFLSSRGQDHREDETNLDRTYARNRIRLDVMPLLETLNPKVGKHLAGLAAEFLALRGLAGEGPASGGPAGGEDLVGILRKAYAEAGGNPDRLERRHFLAVASMMRDLAGDAEPQNLPGGLACFRRGSLLVVGPAAPATAPGIAPTALGVPGSVSAGRWTVSAAEAGVPAAIQGDRFHESLDLDRVELPLLLRSRRPRDRFHPLGAPGRMKLKEFLRAAGVPREERDAVPLVEDASGRILWVVPYRIGDFAKVTPETRRILELRAEEGGKNLVSGAQEGTRSGEDPKALSEG